MPQDINNSSKLIEQYPMPYCQMLELCYGEGMMSEGGEEAIDSLFKGMDLSNKKILEIGYGLGGLASYLKQKFPNINYHGVEINPQMEAFAKEKYGDTNLIFDTLSSPDSLSFEDASFDLVFSKGVLVHLEEKNSLFSEVSRVLKPKGQFIINDWLSPNGKSFGKKIDHMCESEGLILFPTSPFDYQKILEDSSFSIISMEDKTSKYKQYNLDIVERLKGQVTKSRFIELFGEIDYEETVKSYGFIAEAFFTKEALVKQFICEKKLLI